MKLRPRTGTYICFTCLLSFSLAFSEQGNKHRHDSRNSAPLPQTRINPPDFWGSWQERESVLTFNRDWTVKGTISGVVMCESFLVLPPGVKMLDEIDGKHFDIEKVAWHLEGGDRPCQVAIDFGGRQVDFDTSIISFKPEWAIYNRVKKKGGDRTFIFTAEDCKPYVKRLFSSDRSKTYRVLRERIIGALNVDAKYRFDSNRSGEIYRNIEGTDKTIEVMIARFDFARNKLTLASGKNFQVEEDKDSAYEKVSEKKK
jgi:hypothetical protein